MIDTDDTLNVSRSDKIKAGLLTASVHHYPAL